MIPPLCASLGPVLAGPQGCSRGRWRSGPSKWRHTATLGGRGQGAPRTCRCIETQPSTRPPDTGCSQGAPRTCRCIETHGTPPPSFSETGQGAPRTCRCIETGRGISSGSGTARQGAPRTCRCIETPSSRFIACILASQGAPRTCRCIETWRLRRRRCRRRYVREHHAPVGALRQIEQTTNSDSLPVREHHAPVGALRRNNPGADDCDQQKSGSTTHL